jgi:Fe-S-cluster containining protein
MKISLDLPAWADERNIYVMAGIEVVARKHKDGPWEIKTGRCNMCGLCCSNLGPGHPFPLIDGRCIHLAKEVGDNTRWLCSLRHNRPFNCSISAPIVEYCPIKFRTVE